jgi:serine/threonine protein kinase
MDARAAPPEPMFKPKQRFHVFTIIRLMGRGGVSEVYEARFQGQRCVLKVLQRRFHLDGVQIERAKKEAVVLTRLRNENVINVHDAGLHEGIYWMRMELIESIDLRTAIHRLASVSVGLATAWVVQLAYGVHQCHLLGVIHRDVKPENALLTRDNVIKLLDLGLAKMYGDLTTIQSGQIAAPIGTAPYMSPEQAQGQPVTAASDVYALAVVFWELLIGVHPFLLNGAEYDYWPMIHKQVYEDVPPLTDYGLSHGLSDVIARALSKDPSKRPPSALAFADELLAAGTAYTFDHPEEASPGDAELRKLLDELLTPPPFGTGPMPAHRSSVHRPRHLRTAPGLGPATVALASQPERFHTHEVRKMAAPEPPVEERSTDPSPPPEDATTAPPAHELPQQEHPAATRAYVFDTVPQAPAEHALLAVVPAPHGKEGRLAGAEVSGSRRATSGPYRRAARRRPQEISRRVAQATVVAAVAFAVLAALDVVLRAPPAADATPQPSPEKPAAAAVELPPAPSTTAAPAPTIDSPAPPQTAQAAAPAASQVTRTPKPPVAGSVRVPPAPTASASTAPDAGTHDAPDAGAHGAADAGAVAAPHRLFGEEN